MKKKKTITVKRNIDPESLARKEMKKKKLITTKVQLRST